MDITSFKGMISDSEHELLNYAIQNQEFLKSPHARPIRILAEYLYPASIFAKEGVTDTIVFFGSSRIYPTKSFAKEKELSKSTDKSKDTNLGDYSSFFERAVELASAITKWSFEFQKQTGRLLFPVTGGGPGIMEAINRGVQEAGGKSIGLNIDLPFEPNSNPYITKNLNFKFHYFFMRKYWFLYFAKTLVVFPGGFGTLDELFETLALQQTLKKKQSVAVILFGSKFWNRLIDFSFLAESGMISKDNLNLFQMVDTVEAAMEKIQENLQNSQVNDKT